MAFQLKYATALAGKHPVAKTLVLSPSIELILGPDAVSLNEFSKRKSVFHNGQINTIPVLWLPCLAWVNRAGAFDSHLKVLEVIDLDYPLIHLMIMARFKCLHYITLLDIFVCGLGENCANKNSTMSWFNALLRNESAPAR